MENRNGNDCYNRLQVAHVTRSHQQSRNLQQGQTQKHAPKSGLTLLTRSKSKSCQAKEINISTSRGNNKKKLQENRDDSAKFLVRSSSKMEVPRRARSANSSPSAWALSPGRSLHPQQMSISLSLHQVPKSPITPAKSKRDSSSSGVTVSGVLKYFSSKMKKVCPVQEEEYHQFRIMHNRLLQWRFANTRSEVCATALKKVTQKKLFNVWLRMSGMRKHIVEKRTQLQRFKQEIKLYRIISSEMYLLEEWERMESKNCKAVGRLARKLSAISLCFPLVQGSKGDVSSFLDAMSMATEVMDNIEAMITDVQAQVEQMCFLLTELSIIVKEHRDCIIELENGLAALASLEAQERSLRLQYIQLAHISATFNFTK